jgi:hypothetical protein
MFSDKTEINKIYKSNTVLGLNKGLLRRGSLFCFCTFCKRWIKVTYDLKNAKDYNIVPNTHAW